MAAVLFTAAQIAPIFPHDAEIFDFLGEEVIAAGQPLYLTSTGGVKICKAAAAGTAKFLGYALTAGGIGQGISVLKKGHMSGVAISGLAYGATVYVADDGTLADAAGTVSTVAGKVYPMSDSARTKVLYVDAQW